jgi:hypothetical protein
MARKKVTFEEVSEAFDQVKDVLGVNAELKPVSDDDTKCCVVRGDSVQIESLNAMKAGLAVIRTLTGQ